MTLFDIGEENGLPYLAMEFVAGETITSYLERGVRFNPERVIVLVSQVASAIDYAHSRAVIHRDIKPSNLILSEGDRVKVTDFGIAKLADADMTQSGTLLGTPSYMSPEQAMGEKLDGRSDIFSLGVCAFEMLSGEQPFPGTNVTSILYKLVHVDPIEPANLEMNGLVPEKWHQVFGKVLAKKPDERYQTASRFVQDLEYCLGSWFGSAMGDETAAITAMGETATMAAMPSLPAAAGSGVTVVPDEEEVPQTVLLPATPLPAAAPAARAEAEPAPDEGASTVLIQQASEVEEPETLILGAGGRGLGASPRSMGSETLPPVPLETPEDGATVAMASVETVLNVAAVTPSSVAARKVGRRQGGETLAAAPNVAGAASGGRTAAHGTPPPLPTTAVATRQAAAAPSSGPKAAAKGVAAPRTDARRGLPIALVAGVGLLFVLAVVVGLLAVYQLRKGPAGETPEPTAEATPTPAGAEAPPDVVATTEGLVRISTQPPGATVMINGEPRGASPLELRLPLGLYEVQLALAGYDGQLRSIEISAAKPLSELEVELKRPATVAQKGTANIQSNPAGATVVVDGKTVGQTPLRGLELNAGERKIELHKPGYVSTTRTINVRAGRRTPVEVVLAQVASATPRPTPSPDVERVDPARVYLPREVDSPARKTAGTSPDAPAKPAKFRSGDRLSITVTFVVNEEGAVEAIEITDVGDAVLDEKYREGVLRALRKWRFEPATKGGVKVKVRELRKFTYQFG